jgi:nicotinate phosphoribosyltransferase
MVREMAFGEEELEYIRSLAFGQRLREYLARLRFSGDIDAMPEGTIAFAGKPLVRVIAPRVEAQLLKTLLLNQINFQTMMATKAAQISQAAECCRPAAGAAGGLLRAARPRHRRGDMKAALAAAIAG